MIPSKTSSPPDQRSLAQIQNENIQLKEQIRSMQEEIAKYQMNHEILNQDRKLLYQETLGLKEDVVRLQATIGRLELANEKYLALIQQSQDKLQKTKTDQMAAVQSIRAMSNAEQDKEFRTKFNLPEGEFSIVSYSCTTDIQSGFLHITPLYICFEQHLNITLINVITKTSETTITLSIKEIDSLNKVKSIKFLPGKGTSVEIKLKNGSIKLFKSFIKRKECLRNIYNQAKSIGHEIKMLREGEPDENYANEDLDD